MIKIKKGLAVNLAVLTFDGIFFSLAVGFCGAFSCVLLQCAEDSCHTVTRVYTHP